MGAFRHRSGRSRFPAPFDQRRNVALAAAGALVLVFLLVFAVNAFIAQRALKSAVDGVSTLQSELASGDSVGATKALKDLQADTDQARRRTDGIGWDLMARLPLLGDDVAAVQTVADSVDRIADEALQPVVTAASDGGLRGFKPVGGRVDVDALARMAKPLTTANRVLFAERIRADRLEPDHLVGRLATRVEDFQDKIDTAEQAMRAASAVSDVGPALLGADRPRTYLLMFQNNAEIRSTGGLVGAFVILTARDGKLSIDQPGSAGQVLGIAEPVLPLTDDELSIYGPLLGTDFRDVTFTPDFPRAAQLARAMVAEKLGTRVDGVLSMDPVALSYLLRATGPIELADGESLTSDNAVANLLSEVYSRFPDPGAQDAYFGDASQRIFEAVASGVGDSTEVVKALSQGANEHRVMFWSARPREQARINAFELANRLPGATEGPQVGIYLNDATMGKLQYYLTFTTRVRPLECLADGGQTIRATTTLRSTAPAGGKGLAEYVLGYGDVVPPGDQLLVMYVYGPSDGAITSLTVNGRTRPVLDLSNNGRPVTFTPITVKAGATVRVVATIKTRRGQSASGLFMTTPGIHQAPTVKQIYSACED